MNEELENYDSYIQNEVIATLNSNLVALATRIQVIFNLIMDEDFNECICDEYYISEFDHNADCQENAFYIMEKKAYEV